MADKLDDLLLDIGCEADSKVDYAALKAAVLTENAKRKKRQNSYVRYIGMAAAFIALLGVGSIMLFGNGAKAEAPLLAAPSAMAEESAMYDAATEESMVCEEAATEESMVCEEAPAEDSVCGETQARSEEFGSSDSGAGVNGLYSTSSAFSPEDKFFIGVPAEGWQAELTADGVTEVFPVDPVEDLDEGWAYLGPMGGFALWQTSDGTYELFTQTDSREALTSLMQSVCE